MKRRINFAIAGLGTIGAGAVRLFQKNRENILKKAGLDLRLVRVADLDSSRAKALGFSGASFSRDADSIVKATDIDIAVELMGGTGAAKDFILRCMQNGKHVVTANKALLAEHFNAIFSAADKHKRRVGFEASVGGGIPIVKAVTDSLPMPLAVDRAALIDTATGRTRRLPLIP